MKNNIVVFVFIAVCFMSKAQTNYYVDKISGNDANNGTSLATAWQTIQKGANSATANSTVNIKAGTYNENVVINVSGTAGNPITFKNYLNGLVYIDGNGTSGLTLLTISDKNYLNFQNLIFQNKTAIDAQGILVESTGTSTSKNISFKNITIKNIQWTSNASAIPNSSQNAQGLVVYGGNGGVTNITIDSCEVFNNILGFSEAISLDGNVSGFTIKNCKVHDNTNIGIVLAGNYLVSTVPAKDHARNGFVYNNECYNNVSNYATSAGIYVDGGKNIIIEKNKCYGNGNGIEIGCEENGTTDSITVKNNLIYNNTNVGIYVGGYTTATSGQVLRSVIRNNTIFQNNSANDGTGEMNISKASNCSIINNVFYTNSQNVLLSVDNISPQTNNVINYNCWFTPSNNSNNITVNWKTLTYNSFATYKTGTSQEANSIYANPLLTTATLPTPNLHLQSTSPCINAGMPTTTISLGETDYDNTTRIIGTAIDMGAYEFSIATSINEFVTNNESIAFPNPFSEQTIIRLEKPLLTGELRLYNQIGELILRESIQNQTEISISKNDKANDIYVYEIIENNCLISKGKLVIVP